MTRGDKQVGALCLRMTRRGLLRVLLVTSRDTGRWVIPKGWPMTGLDDPAAAAVEALQEAGVSGRIEFASAGTYRYVKADVAVDKPLSVTVYRLWVETQGRRWPERAARKRRWFTIARAAALVAEPELAALIAAHADLESKHAHRVKPRRKVARVRAPASPL